MEKIVGIKVNQWRSDWDAVAWNKKARRSEPQHWFYQFSIRASLLREWSGVNARTTNLRLKGRDDLGIQRRHESKRSEEISRYVEFGYPWSDLSEKKRNDPEYNSLRKPGWLPTAIVVNILTAGDSRNGKKVAKEDLVKVSDRKDGLAELAAPSGYKVKGWSFADLPPIEVIDGQHRLWAFDSDATNDFELPVVAFVGLDLSWQAYLFYTINIKPKKINASLAFDLYPLLRAEDWLDKFEGHIVYRETRAQELVDLLWSHKSSPWYQRINMLGESGQRGKTVTQAAWIRALLATFVRSYEGPNVRLGGLYGAPAGSHEEVLPWSRIEQAAFLMFVGSKLAEAVKTSTASWALNLRRDKGVPLFEEKIDAAFFSEHSLLSQDQGIRAFLHIANDLFYLNSDELDLTNTFEERSVKEEDEEAALSASLKSLSKQKGLVKFVDALVTELAKYDWRAVSAPNLPEEERILKAGFRGSGGYKQLRLALLRRLEATKGQVGAGAKTALKLLGA
ncbi:MAG TPA: DGQHR domain-containing protein [Solimonas sp.]|nr:DGQHR domain-containing protein [Solimonas sp.]